MSMPSIVPGIGIGGPSPGAMLSGWAREPRKQVDFAAVGPKRPRGSGLEGHTLV